MCTLPQRQLQGLHDRLRVSAAVRSHVFKSMSRFPLPAVLKDQPPARVHSLHMLQPAAHLPGANHKQRLGGWRAVGQQLWQAQHVVCMLVRQPHALQTGDLHIRRCR